ncbi:MAG: hypothetical protein K8T20_05945 [Planctomycetes bacterium]|nr:hypothetical protein [Planctomycetota bacterium]
MTIGLKLREALREPNPRDAFGGAVVMLIKSGQPAEAILLEIQMIHLELQKSGQDALDAIVTGVAKYVPDISPTLPLAPAKEPPKSVKEKRRRKSNYVFDKAKYHVQGNYPVDLPPVNACTHTAFFLGWLIDNDLVSKLFLNESGEHIQKFRERRLTPTEVYSFWDEVLVSSMLNAAGNCFAADYFELSSGRYLRDYEEILGAGLPSLYHVPPSWDNYERISARITERYKEFNGSKP